VLDDGGTPHDQNNDAWSTYTIAEGLVDDRAQTIAVSPEGTVWVGTDDGISRSVERRTVYLPCIQKNWHQD
jgi:ligand-binding sensor domain-containing protein